MAPIPTYEALKKEIIQLKRSAAKLKAESDKYQAIYNHNSNCIYIHDLNGNFIDANDAALNLLGYRRKDISTLNLSSLISADQLSIAHSAIEEIVNNGSQKQISEYNVRKKDGTLGWIETESSLIYSDSKPYAIHGVARDVTQRKMTEKALTTSEKNYRELVQSINSVILKLDPQGNIIFLNAFAKTFFGYKEEELISKNVIGTIVPKTESSGRDLIAMVRDLSLRPERYLNNDNENMRKNGERVWVAWSNKGIQAKGGNIKEILCVGNDITKRKQAENALQARERELENKAEDLKDMNTALHVLLKKREKDKLEMEEKVNFNVRQLIEPYLDALKRTPLSQRQKSLFGIIENGLIEIVEPFGDRFGSAKHKLTPQEIKVSVLIRQGKTTKDIAEIMGISSRTVDFHRTKIRRKLGLKSQSENLRSYLSSLQ